jgi:hypothetical protein
MKMVHLTENIPDSSLWSMAENFIGAAELPASVTMFTIDDTAEIPTIKTIGENIFISPEEDAAVFSEVFIIIPYDNY